MKLNYVINYEHVWKDIVQKLISQKSSNLTLFFNIATVIQAFFIAQQEDFSTLFTECSQLFSKQQGNILRLLKRWSPRKDLHLPGTEAQVARNDVVAVRSMDKIVTAWRASAAEHVTMLLTKQAATFCEEHVFLFPEESIKNLGTTLRQTPTKIFCEINFFDISVIFFLYY